MLRGDKIGEGTYGIVYSANSPNSSRKYAIKRNLAENNTTFLSSARELDILNRVRDHPHLVRLEKVAFSEIFQDGIFSPLCGDSRESQRNDNVHFVFEEASYDLHKFIYGAQIVDYSVIKRYIVNILLGVEHMHASKIIHRDIKPSNILIFGDEPDAMGVANVAKICDFGLSKPYTYQGSQTPSVVTSWYRPPEIVLGYKHYDYKVDVWSLGCMFFEMIAVKSFISAKDKNDILLKAILKQLPSEVNIQNYRKIYQFVQNCEASDFINVGKERPKMNRNLKRKSMKEKLGLTQRATVQFEKEAGSLNSFCNLLCNMIKFEWDKRYTVSECLNHEFFDDHRELIYETRKKYCVEENSDYAIQVKSCVERRWMADIATQIFTCRHRLSWYSDRVLFQAMDLYDRYISTMFLCTKIPNNAVESDIKGFIHDKHSAELRFMCCVYLSIKFFSSIQVMISFDDIVCDDYKTQQSKLIAEQFEIGLIKNCLGYNIYRPTIYEAADAKNVYLTEKNVGDLITLYSSDESISGMTPHEVIAYYFDHGQGKHVLNVSKQIQHC